MSLTGVEVELELAGHNGAIVPKAVLHLDGDQSSTQILNADAMTEAVNGAPIRISRSRATVIITILTGVSFLNTMGSGLLTVGLPRIASDLGLPENLLLWYDYSSFTDNSTV